MFLLDAIRAATGWQALPRDRRRSAVSPCPDSAAARKTAGVVVATCGAEAKRRHAPCYGRRPAHQRPVRAHGAAESRRDQVGRRAARRICCCTVRRAPAGGAQVSVPSAAAPGRAAARSSARSWSATSCARRAWTRSRTAAANAGWWTWRCSRPACAELLPRRRHQLLLLVLHDERAETGGGAEARVEVELAQPGRGAPRGRRSAVRPAGCRRWAAPTTGSPPPARAASPAG